ncbi:MAG: RluA family pseudouridine synthase [Bdellovibrionales bacterium]|nr:RluA family pseudouridine synthase [Bdellovibrionales bacterium]
MSLQIPNNLEILYEDEFLFAINKPAEIHSVMLEQSDSPSIAQILIESDPLWGEVSSKIEDAGLVNRLDFETSGILLAAKSKQIWIDLRATILSESVYKSYVALVEGHLCGQHEIDNFIGTSARRAKKVKVFLKEPRKKDRALPAKSEFVSLRYVEHFDATFVRAIIYCARRHQVRAHAQFLNHPLLGDELYGSTRNLTETIGAKSPGFFLHGERMKFVHPVSNEIVDISAPIPDWTKPFL